MKAAMIGTLRHLKSAGTVALVTVLAVAIACVLLASLALAWSAEGEDEEAGEVAQEELYLKARDELAPVLVLSREELDRAVAEGGASFEMCGALTGIASCAAPSDEQLMSVTLSLEKGGQVPLRAAVDICDVRVGEPVCIIAQPPPPGTGSRDLRVAAWVRLWDLAIEVRPGADDPVEVAPPEPPAEPTEQELVPGAVAPYQLDSVQVWQAWVLEHNPKLTPQQAENIVQWVLRYAQQYDVNHKLIFALIKWESWFNPSCVSHSGAIGLMQLMPGTARYLGVDPWKVEQNIEGGVHYLSEQLAAYANRPNNERVILALACYNAGPNAVKRAGGVPNITETQRYVRKVSNTFRELHQAGFP